MSGWPGLPSDDVQGEVSALGRPSACAAGTGHRAVGHPHPWRMGIILSLCAHGALLACFLTKAAISPAGDRFSEPIELVIAGQPQPVAPPQAVPAAAEADPAPVAPDPLPKARIPPPRPKVSAKETPRPVFRQTAPAVGPADDQGGALPDGGLPAAAATAQPAISAKADPTAAEDEELRQFAVLVRSHLLAHKPRRIRLRGTVGLSFSVAADGTLIAARISASSGSDILDQAALDALQEAAPFPPFPRGLAVSRLSYLIPFHFY